MWPFGHSASMEIGNILNWIHFITTTLHNVPQNLPLAALSAVAFLTVDKVSCGIVGK